MGCLLSKSLLEVDKKWMEARQERDSSCEPDSLGAEGSLWHLVTNHDDKKLAQPVSQHKA